MLVGNVPDPVYAHVAQAPQFVTIVKLRVKIATHVVERENAIIAVDLVNATTAMEPAFLNK